MIQVRLRTKVLSRVVIDVARGPHAHSRRVLSVSRSLGLRRVSLWLKWSGRPILEVFLLLLVVDVLGVIIGLVRVLA